MELLSIGTGRVCPGAEQRMREALLVPPPTALGLLARYWRAQNGCLQGRYLFDGQIGLQEFVDNPAIDAALNLLGTGANEPLAWRNVEELKPVDEISCPLFLISAPRAGRTVLYNLLSRSPDLWTTGEDSSALIEAIPALHPANRGFDSHRLDDLAADVETVRILRACLTAELINSRGRRFVDLPEDERPGHVRLLDNTAENVLRVPFLATAFPSARFVFLHQDPRQNVNSILEGWHQVDLVKIPELPGWPRRSWHFVLPEGWRSLCDAGLLEIAAFQWNAVNARALDDLEGLPSERWISIDSAELLLSPEAVVRRICEFSSLNSEGWLATSSDVPVPLEPTAGCVPSPVTWCSNPEFRESVLDRFRLTSGRLRTLGRLDAPPPSPGQPDSPVRYHCFVDELIPSKIHSATDLVVSPSFVLQLGPTIPLSLLRRTRFRERFLQGFPILWVEDFVTGVNYPFWTRRERIGLIRQFVAGQPPPVLPDGYAAQLVEAGVLVSLTAIESLQRSSKELCGRACSQFTKRRYCQLPGLVHPAHVSALWRYYEALIGQGKLALGDEQVRLRYGWHNELVSRYFHGQLAQVVSRTVSEPARPSYTYLSAYRPGAVLRPHVDRKQCVFTLSLMIEDRADSSREPWPLWFQTDSGKVSVTQSSGDGVLFRGCELPHWRDRPPMGHSSTTLIFHYVPREFTETLD